MVGMCLYKRTNLAYIIGERERANLGVRTVRFFRYLYIYITGVAYVVSNSTLHAHAHAHVKLQFLQLHAIHRGPPPAGAGALQTPLVKAIEEAHPLCIPFLYV